MSFEYPSLLRPNASETLIVDGQQLTIPKVTLQLRSWTGASLQDTFGNKPLIDFGGRPVFAELCVYELAWLSGWQARWVETYGTGAMNPKYFTEWADAGLTGQQHEPIADERIQQKLKQIAQANNNSFAGCWDVVCWNGDALLFAELKRYKKDRIRPTQPRWLEAALRTGLQPANFLLVEWDLAA